MRLVARGGDYVDDGIWESLPDAKESEQRNSRKYDVVWRIAVGAYPSTWVDDYQQTAPTRHRCRWLEIIHGGSFHPVAYPRNNPAAAELRFDNPGVEVTSLYRGMGRGGVSYTSEGRSYSVPLIPLEHRPLNRRQARKAWSGHGRRSHSK